MVLTYYTICYKYSKAFIHKKQCFVALIAEK